MKDQAQSVVYMDYTRDKYIKRRLTDELQNPMTDYALLSHHGDPTIQYLSGVKDPLDILVTAEFSNYHPQTPLVSLDACYNGSFHLDDNIQEAYLFGKGKIHGARCSMQFVVPEYQHKGVNTAMFYEAFMGGKALGIQWVEGSTVDETDVASIANTEKMASHLYRIYREYEKSLLQTE